MKTLARDIIGEKNVLNILKTSGNINEHFLRLNGAVHKNVLNVFRSIINLSPASCEVAENTFNIKTGRRTVVIHFLLTVTRTTKCKLNKANRVNCQ